MREFIILRKKRPKISKTRIPDFKRIDVNQLREIIGEVS